MKRFILNKHSLIAVVMSIMMVFTLFGAMPTQEASAAESISGEGWSFDGGTGTLTITTNAGTTAWRESVTDRNIIKSVEIQSSVTSIEMSAFSECNSLTSITIPSGVTYIGGYAFYGCSSLTSINIPSGVTYIEQDAFYGCSALTSITIPSGVTRIRGGAFYGCSSLKSITLPSSLRNLDSAFAGCSSLTSINIPSGVTYIAGDTFNECSSLKSIKIPSGVIYIASSAFKGCSSLTSITMPMSIPMDDWAYIGQDAFSGCSSLTSITIPYGATYIDKGTFEGCSSLTSITIPSSVTSIEDSAFRECSSLTSITIPNNVMSIGEYVFYGCSSLESIYIQSGNMNYSSQDGVLFDKSKTMLVTVPGGKTGGFTIPNSVTSIGDSAFRECSSLTSITIPDSVTSIGEYAFYGCSDSLKLRVVKDSVAYQYVIKNGLPYELIESASVERTVTFNANGGSAVPSRVVDHDSAIGSLPTTARTGYTFEGWYTSAVGGTKIDANQIITEDVTFYAQWKLVSPQDPTPNQDSGTSNQNPTPNPDKKTTNQNSTPRQNITALRSPLKTLYVTKGKAIVPPLDFDGKDAKGKTWGYQGYGTTPKLTWTSSNTSIATVNKTTGKITAKNIGTAKITAKTLNGKSITFTVKVVKTAKKLTKIAFTKPPQRLKAGSTTQLKLKLTPAKATNLKVTFKSSNPSILKVDKAGKLFAVKDAEGTAKITVKAGGKSKVIVVEVLNSTRIYYQ